MEQRLSTKEADVTNIAVIKDIESGSELLCIDPSQIGCRYLAPGEIAEIAGGVAGVGHRDVTEPRSPMAK
jgi:hypothetical protein